MASTRTNTFLKDPRRILLFVISAKKLSTRFNQEEEVGVKCR